MAILGIPSLTKKSFMSIDKWTGQWALFEDLMKEAGAAERAIAISNRIYHRGVLVTTVIVDGGWINIPTTTRTMPNLKWASKLAKKLENPIFRSKEWILFSLPQSCRGNVPPHTWFFNYDESLSTMKTDLILKGFIQSEEQYGLQYTQFIGDGYSQVYPVLSLVCLMATVFKNLVTNHAVKCYYTVLHSLVHDKSSNKGRAKLTEIMRKITKVAILMCSQEPDKIQAVKKLQQNLMNNPLHCFGCHSNCSPLFLQNCTTALPTTEQQWS